MQNTSTMDSSQNRGRSSLSGSKNHISPTPSPHQPYHDAVSSVGLDPAAVPPTFTTAKFNNNTTPFLDSTPPLAPPSSTAESTFYPNNQFIPTAFHNNQWSGHAFPPYAQSDLIFQNNMPSGFN